MYYVSIVKAECSFVKKQSTLYEDVPANFVRSSHFCGKCHPRAAWSKNSRLYRQFNI